MFSVPFISDEKNNALLLRAAAARALVCRGLLDGELALSYVIDPSERLQCYEQARSHADLLARLRRLEAKLYATREAA